MPKLLLGITGKDVRRRAHFERSIGLEAFGLEPDLLAGAPEKGEQRRADRIVANCFSRCVQSPCSDLLLDLRLERHARFASRASPARRRLRRRESRLRNTSDISAISRETVRQSRTSRRS